MPHWNWKKAGHTNRSLNGGDEHECDDSDNGKLDGLVGKQGSWLVRDG